MKICSEKLRYLAFGLFNTLIGYVIGILVYHFLNESIGILGVGIVANIFSITFSFLMYKLFVFKTKKSTWLKEYLRAYLVYGVMALVGIFLLWVFIQKMDLSIWISQALVIICTFTLSFIGHKKFTFRVK